uniref:Uncharacterized protein n=1 Tax=viral metagenome TaxID=1070528 RepID=A0A6C0ESI5_9ZZZZ
MSNEVIDNEVIDNEVIDNEVIDNEVIDNEVIEKNEKEILINYIKQMTPLQKVAYEIAKKHLKSSFCIEKSIGYKIFKNV